VAPTKGGDTITRKQPKALKANRVKYRSIVFPKGGDEVTLTRQEQLSSEEPRSRTP
jgi:hypothetical protein